MHVNSEKHCFTVLYFWTQVHRSIIHKSQDGEPAEVSI